MAQHLQNAVSPDPQLLLQQRPCSGDIPFLPGQGGLEKLLVFVGLGKLLQQRSGLLQLTLGNIAAGQKRAGPLTDLGIMAVCSPLIKL